MDNLLRAAVPDPRARRAVAELAGAFISSAHGRSPGSWVFRRVRASSAPADAKPSLVILTALRYSLGINVGLSGGYVEGVEVGVDWPTLKATKQRLEDLGCRITRGFDTVEGGRAVLVPSADPESLVQAIGLLLPAVDPYVAKMVRAGTRTQGGSRKHHESELVSEVSQLLGRDLPNPSFDASTEVDDERPLPLPSATWLLTWNPGKWSWPEDELDRLLRTLGGDSEPRGRWSTGVTKALRRGDRFYLVRLGKSSPGLIASGRVLGSPYETEHWAADRSSTRTALYADIRYDELLDPRSKAVLPLEVLGEKFPDVAWTPQASGVRIDDAILSSLEVEWQRHLWSSGEGPLRLSASIGQIQESLGAFDDALAAGYREVLFAVVHPEYWVVDDAGRIAPAKWAGLRGMTPVVYSALQQLSREESSPRGFNGGRTRKAIEGATGAAFQPNPAVAAGMLRRFTERFGSDAAGDGVSETRWLKVASARRYWWVNQSSGLEGERAGGYLEATLTTEGGAKPRHHSDIERLAKGDIVFCNQRGKISAVATVSGAPQQISRRGPVKIRVSVSYEALDPEIAIPSIATKVLALQGDYGPITQVGRPKQGYLFPVAPAAAQVLLDRISPGNRGPVSLGERHVQPQNVILFGPPGTGKTYDTARRAVELCDEEAPADRAELMALYRTLSDAGRIELVTFHQSFSYEDFVEGIRPVVLAPEGETGSVRYECRDGVFKQLCASASRKVTQGTGLGDIDEGVRLWKMSIGQSGATDDEELYEEAINEGLITMGWGDPLDFSLCTDPSAIRKELEDARPSPATASSYAWQAVERFKNQMAEGDLVVVSSGLHAFRAIGRITGPYQFRDRERHCQTRQIEWLVVFDTPQPIDRIYRRQLSQATIYRLAADTTNLEGLREILRSPMAESEALPHVLIIDEINRGNISKVLGELITLLEPDKRIGAPNELRVRLPYSGEKFGVPANLHILGTMNSADRSIALLDTALRRRFTFEEMRPEPGVLRGLGVDGSLGGVDVPRLLEVMNDRIELLLDRDHALGHAYFIWARTLEDLRRIFTSTVIPLLNEYFYGDSSRVAAVLGCPYDESGEQRNKSPILSAQPLNREILLGGSDTWDARIRCTVSERFLEASNEALAAFLQGVYRPAGLTAIEP